MVIVFESFPGMKRIARVTALRQRDGAFASGRSFKILQEKRNVLITKRLVCLTSKPFFLRLVREG